jgi:hypothetical protein
VVLSGQLIVGIFSAKRGLDLRAVLFEEGWIAGPTPAMTVRINLVQ